jgi:beta-N-acetylhexosaminidase
MRRLLILLLLASASFLAFSCSSSSRVGDRHPTGASLLALRDARWIDSVLSTMTLEAKIGQLIMVRIPGHYFSTENEEFARLVHLVREDKVGGMVMLQGDVYETAILLNRLQQMADVPILVAADYERGVAMRTRRATYIGDAMAIGATRDTSLAYQAGRVIAEEARAIGVHQNFAPVADVNDDPRNPVINTRSFGDNRELVASMVDAFVRGTNDGGGISTVKHFPGHGSTGKDSHVELPVLASTRSRLDSVELYPFRRAIVGGVKSVMTAHLSVPALDPSFAGPASLSARIIDSLLEHDMGFSGLVITDALEMQAITKEYSSGDAAVRAVKAGTDMLLVPVNEDVAITALLREVRGGGISEERLNTSVRKILSVKQSLGIDLHRTVDIGRISEVVGTNGHFRLAREISRRAVTVLRNDRGILPLVPGGKEHLMVISVGDIDEALTEVNRPGALGTVEPIGGYLLQQIRRRNSQTEFCRLTPTTDVSIADSVISRARHADVVLLALYIKVRTGTGKIGIPENFERFISRFSGVAAPTVVLSFGNPYLVSAFPSARALLCTYSDAELPVESSVEALFGEIPVTGKLPVNISPDFGFGAGISLSQIRLRRDDPAAAGFDAEALHRVDRIVREAIRDSAFPAAQVAIVKDGMLVYNKAFGTLTYDPKAKETSNTTRFDLASLTKVIATTAAVMKLYDTRQLSLDDTVSQYLPQFTGGRKGSVTIRQLMIHRSGLPPFRKLWELCPTPQAALDTIFTTPLVANPGDSMIYSDLGMIIMGKIVEKISGMSLAAFVEKEFYGPLNMTNTGYTPPAAQWPQIAPTEIDTLWRKKLVQGTVHDENAAFLGGVSGHAGLFSTASDLAIFMQLLMDNGTYGGKRFVSDSTVRLFTRRHSPEDDRAIGWDFKSPRGSSAGSLFSPSSFGHTGFTGTSIWVDPDRNLCVILLTNRVYPTRTNMKISKIRPAVHDAIINALVNERVSH